MTTTAIENIITIPKRMTGREELVVLSRKEFERLTRFDGYEKEIVTEDDVLRWSREARVLHKKGKLPLLRSLKEFRDLS